MCIFWLEEAYLWVNVSSILQQSPLFPRQAICEATRTAFSSLRVSSDEYRRSLLRSRIISLVQFAVGAMCVRYSTTKLTRL